MFESKGVQESPNCFLLKYPAQVPVTIPDVAEAEMESEAMENPDEASQVFFDKRMLEYHLQKSPVHPATHRQLSMPVNLTVHAERIWCKSILSSNRFISPESPIFYLVAPNADYEKKLGEQFVLRYQDYMTLLVEYCDPDQSHYGVIRKIRLKLANETDPTSSQCEVENFLVVNADDYSSYYDRSHTGLMLNELYQQLAIDDDGDPRQWQWFDISMADDARTTQSDLANLFRLLGGDQLSGEDEVKEEIAARESKVEELEYKLELANPVSQASATSLSFFSRGSTRTINAKEWLMMLLKQAGIYSDSSVHLATWREDNFHFVPQEATGIALKG